VGVVGHVRYWGLASDDVATVRSQFYYPFAQVPDRLLRRWSELMSISVRTSIAPLNMIETIQRGVRGSTNDQVLYEVNTLEQLVKDSLARQRFLARLTKLVQNIIQWRKYTSERYGIGELATRLVNKCIAPVAESGWDVGGMESVRKVSETHGNTAGFTGDEEHKNMQVMTILPPELVPLSLKTRLQ